MGSIPQVCRSLRLFGPLQQMLCTIPRRHASRQSTIIFATAENSAVAIPMGQLPQRADSLPEWRADQPAHRARKVIRNGRSKAASLFVRISPRDVIRESLRACAGDFESGIVSVLGFRLALVASRPSLLQPSMEARVGIRLMHFHSYFDCTSLPKRAALPFAGHDRDIMNCNARSSVHGCRGPGGLVVRVPAGPTTSLERQAFATSTALLLIRHHKQRDRLRREAVIADRARRPAS